MVYEIFVAMAYCVWLTGVMEGGKPILRGGGPEEVEENDMTGIK